MLKEQCLCHLCKNDVKDDFHFLFQCDKLHVLRAHHFGANFREDFSILNNPRFSFQLAANYCQAFKISLRCS